MGRLLELEEAGRYLDKWMSRKQPTLDGKITGVKTG